MVKKLEEKGVRFNLMTRTQAAKFLAERNNYMRLASYRKNYEKYDQKYVNLDFKYLVELSTIDMYLRFIIIKMCLNIEHCLKVSLLKNIENNADEDGYSIVNEFINSSRSNAYITSEIKKMSSSKYSGELIEHYFQYTTEFCGGETVMTFDCPVWVFTETVSFGTFINFYLFYYNKYPNEKAIPRNIINSVRSLRNACAHNNCIMHDLHKTPESTQPPTEISKFVMQIADIKSVQRRNKLSNQFILEFVTAVYVFGKVVSEDLKKTTIKELKSFAENRLLKNVAYFERQPLIKSSLTFLKKVIDFACENTYNK